MHSKSEPFKPDKKLGSKWYPGKALDKQSRELCPQPHSLSMSCKLPELGLNS